MLYCSCGFSCGVKAALDRHLAKFAGTESEAEHGHSLPLPALPPRGVKSAPNLARSLDIDEDGAETDELQPTKPAKQPVPTPPRTCRESSGRQAMVGTLEAGDFKSLKSEVRLLLVRHAQSANKCRLPGQVAEADPGLTDYGLQQANALGHRLAKDFRSTKVSRVTFVSSPMRRCLLTMQPAVSLLQLTPENVLCHGGSYEFGCAGKAFVGSTAEEISTEYPEFKPVGFAPDNAWDYQGNTEKETEQECRARGVRLVEWLFATAAASGEFPHTIVLATHQTINDLICSILVDGSAERWRYGEIRYRLQTAGITEVLADPGKSRLGVQNDGTHLFALKNK
ncbi:unnamed protein product [Effrenium voratum]|nr:unnamed protein product [Effrenium voratum]